MSQTPLIVYCIFGVAYARMLQLSLQSLRCFGGYGGAIAVLTDLERPALAAACPRVDEPAIRVVRVAAADELTAKLCRYELYHHVRAAHHAPIVYVDADIVFDGPIQPMLDAVSCARRICFPAEYASHLMSHAMGGNLLRATGCVAEGHGFNSGTFGLPNGAEPVHRETLEYVAKVTRRLWLAKPTLFRRWIDQPVANYLHVAHDRSLFDTERLASFFRWAFVSDEPAHGCADRLGAVHFFDGRKLERMRAYVEHLIVQPPGTAPWN